jgi:hypothetical protein
VRLALYVCIKNICDSVGGEDKSNDTPLDPALFWLDNIFNPFLFIRGLHQPIFPLKIFRTVYEICRSLKVDGNEK